jgi:hypothetical protein
MKVNIALIVLQLSELAPECSSNHFCSFILDSLSHSALVTLKYIEEKPFPYCAKENNENFAGTGQVLFHIYVVFLNIFLKRCLSTPHCFAGNVFSSEYRNLLQLSLRYLFYGCKIKVNSVLVYLKSGVGSAGNDGGLRRYEPSFICTYE